MRHLYSDPNCGAALSVAEGDYLLGMRCAQKKPSNPVVAPSMKPVCV